MHSGEDGDIYSGGFFMVDWTLLEEEARGNFNGFGWTKIKMMRLCRYLIVHM